MHQVFFHIRTPKDDQTTPEAVQTIFATLLSNYVSLWHRLTGKHPPHYSFEIFQFGQTIYYYIACDAAHATLIESLIQSVYPRAHIVKTTDPLKIVTQSKQQLFGELFLKRHFSIPIKTYKDFGEIDPLANFVGLLSKQPQSIRFGLQIIITPTYFNWQIQASKYANHRTFDPKTQAYKETKHASSVEIAEKSNISGGKVVMRLIVGSDRLHITQDNMRSVLQAVTASFASLSGANTNSIHFRQVKFFKKKFLAHMVSRRSTFFERRLQIMNAQELATLWHPTGQKLAGIKNISWGKKLPGEPPQNLPVSMNLDTIEKDATNFFAKTEYKNTDTIFGIKSVDRRRHIYIIGKTGTGKSTLITNMAIDDIRRGRGIGVIDPHGDLAETLLEYIPKRRVNDVVYLEPFDESRPFALNVLEVRNKQQRDLVSSGIVAIFSKLYAGSWGPRLEYILRNTILTLLELPSATLPDALRLLSDAKWRDTKLKQVQDPILLQFWHNEYDKYSDRLRAEAIAPIQNKLGQFVSSKMVRHVIDSATSTIDLQHIMDEGKILILNLSQGKLGEDNAALLGAMFITQMQLAAMNRAFIKEEDRKDFFLYVDEFQNFATSSFIKILSEARKYRLALTLTNQYIEQLSPEIQTAIFGNVGTLVSFVMGSRDAEIFSKEYSGLYTPNDLVSLGKHEVIVKLCIDNMTSSPFPAKTLAPPTLKNMNKEKIIAYSRARYGRDISSTTPIKDKNK